MNPLGRLGLIWLVIGVVSITRLPAGAEVNLLLKARQARVAPSDMVEVKLVAIHDAKGSARIAALSVILTWDPTAVRLVEAVEVPETDWFVSGFLPDPDGINDSFEDGDAIFTALSSTADIIEVPDAGAVMAVFLFEAGSPSPGVPINIIEQMGDFGQTQVFDADQPNLDLVGTIAGTTIIIVRCGEPDSELDGDVDLIDFAVFQQCFSGAGNASTSTCTCLFDSDADGDVDLIDYVAFQAWLEA
jgi:hypothetical protein